MHFACTASSAEDIDLNSKTFLQPFGGEMLFYKTYFKPGDAIILNATWKPFNLWKNTFSERIVTVSFKISGNNIINQPILESSWPYSSDIGASGMGVNWVLPSTVIIGKPIKITATLTVPGIITKSVHSYIYPTNEISHDLKILFMGEFEQGDWAWGTDHLGTCNTTIAKEGCATTAKAFVFSYYYDAGWNRPDTLNECLTSNGGYINGCLIPGVNPNDYLAASKCTPYGVYWNGYDAGNGNALSQEINQWLDFGYPVIVKAKQYSDKHYYVIIGRRGEKKWNVFDPLDGQIHRMEDVGLTNNMILGTYVYSHWE
jgi:hypothetical protein